MVEQEVLKTTVDLIEEEGRLNDKITNYLVNLSKEHTIEFPMGYTMTLGPGIYATVMKISKGRLWVEDYKHDSINIATLDTTDLVGLLYKIKTSIKDVLHPDPNCPFNTKTIIIK